MSEDVSTLDSISSFLFGALDKSSELAKSYFDFRIGLTEGEAALELAKKNQSSVSALTEYEAYGTGEATNWGTVTTQSALPTWAIPAAAVVFVGFVLIGRR